MTWRARILILVLLLGAIGGGAFWYLSRGEPAKLSVEAVTGPRPTIAEPDIQTIPTFGVAKAVGWPAGGKPIAAPGLEVAAFADKLDHPRWLYELPNGDVLVAESKGPPSDEGGITGFVMKLMFERAGSGGASANRITLLRDTNGDGVADFRSVLLSGLSSPFGMALVRDRLYVGNHDALVAFPYKAGDTRITAPAQTVVALPPGGRHWAKNVVADPAGTHLYISVGSSSNIAENGIDAEAHRANILDLDLKTNAIRILTAGLRNPVGMGWEPHSKALWTVVNERDQLGSDVPPDYLTRADFGAFYGWPYSYWGGHVDPRTEDREDLLPYTKRPDYALGPHTASLGLAFGSLGAFHDGAFVGQHGSWNRQPPSGYKVAFIPFAPTGFPNGPMRDVLTGFLDAKGQAQGRPVGVIVLSKGDLLVADDVGNRVWRVSAK